MFSALPAAFLYDRVFVYFSARLAVYFFFCRLFGFWDLNKANFNGNEHNGCVNVRYNSLFFSLPLFTKVHKTPLCEIATLCIFERMWTIGRPIFKISFSSFEVLHILFGIFLTA